MKTNVKIPETHSVIYLQNRKRNKKSWKKWILISFLAASLFNLKQTLNTIGEVIKASFSYLKDGFIWLFNKFGSLIGKALALLISVFGLFKLIKRLIKRSKDKGGDKRIIKKENKLIKLFKYLSKRLGLLALIACIFNLNTFNKLLNVSTGLTIGSSAALAYYQNQAKDWLWNASSNSNIEKLDLVSPAKVLAAEILPKKLNLNQGEWDKFQKEIDKLSSGSWNKDTISALINALPNGDITKVKDAIKNSIKTQLKKLEDNKDLIQQVIGQDLFNDLVDLKQTDLKELETRITKAKIFKFCPYSYYYPDYENNNKGYGYDVDYWGYYSKTIPGSKCHTSFTLVSKEEIGKGYRDWKIRYKSWFFDALSWQKHNYIYDNHTTFLQKFLDLPWAEIGTCIGIAALATSVVAAASVALPALATGATTSIASVASSLGLVTTTGITTKAALATAVAGSSLVALGLSLIKS